MKTTTQPAVEMDVANMQSADAVLGLMPFLGNDQGNTNQRGVAYKADEARYNDANASKDLTEFANGLWESWARTGRQFANVDTSRFTEAHYSEPLTSYSVGWRDPNNIEATLEFCAPKVNTGRRFEFAAYTNAEEFLTESDDVRHIYGDFKRVAYSSRKVPAVTLNKGLTMRVDVDAMGETVQNWRELYTGRLMRRLLRNELIRAINAMAAAVAAGVGDQSASGTWSAASGQDPDKDARTLVDGVSDLVGFQINRALYGRKALTWRRNTYGQMNAPAGYAGYVGMNPDQIADSIGVDELLVSKERYTSSPSGKTQVVAANVYVYMAEANQTPEDPSAIKRFVSPTAGGTPFRVYEQQVNAKLFDITVEHYSQIIVTAPRGIGRLTVTTG